MTLHYRPKVQEANNDAGYLRKKSGKCRRWVWDLDDPPCEITAVQFALPDPRSPAITGARTPLSYGGGLLGHRAFLDVPSRRGLDDGIILVPWRRGSDNLLAAILLQPLAPVQPPS